MSEAKSGAELVNGERWNRQADDQTLPNEIYDLMMAEFGGGDRPDLRLPWFEKIDKSCQRGGPRRRKAVLDTMSRSKSKKNPARWFVTTVTRKFEDLGWV